MAASLCDEPAAPHLGRMSSELFIDDLVNAMSMVNISYITQDALDVVGSVATA